MYHVAFIWLQRFSTTWLTCMNFRCASGLLPHSLLRWFPCLRNPRLIWMSTYPWNSHPNLPSIRYPIGCRQSSVDLGLLGILLTKQFRARYLLVHTQLHTCMLQQCHYTWMFSSPPPPHIFLPYTFPPCSPLMCTHHFYTCTQTLIKVCHVALLCTTCDLPAKAMLLNFVQFNGFYGCSRCLQKGE